MATLSIDNAPKVVLKENDNIDNSLIKKVVSRCHSLLFEENDNIDNKDNKFIKSCFTLLSEINDNKDNKLIKRLYHVVA